MYSRNTLAYVFPFLGWKREGPRPFQESRLDLVQILDQLVVTLAQTDSHPGILIGGETIVLDDYREIRGSAYQSIAELVRSHRLIVGPWYVLPHFFLASGESLVRNLLVGISDLQDSGVFEAPGYLAKEGIFIGQLPQILESFGIRNVVIPDQRQNVLYSAHCWVGRDGSEVKLLHVPIIALDSNGTDSLAGSENYKDSQVILAKLEPSLVLPLVDSLSANLASYEQVEMGINNAEIAGKATSLELGRLLNTTYSAAGSFSARMWMKQRNHLVESLLLGWAEPFGAWAVTMEADPADPPISTLHDPNGILGFAWQALLKNQSTEVLSGNIVDSSANEAAVRFDRAEQITKYVIGESLRSIAGRIDLSNLLKRKQSYPIAVFNGTSISRRDVVAVDLPVGLVPDAVEVVDGLGKTIPFDIIPDQNDSLARSRVQFAADIPGTGYATYAIRKSRKRPSQIATDSGESIENEFLSVQIDTTDGTFSLYDKRTARLFVGLNHYRDGGDSGNLAYYQAPERDTVIDIATNTPLRTQRRMGNVVQSLELFQIFRLPQTLTDDRTSRLPLTAQFVPVSIWTTLRLVRGVARVDVNVTVSNAAMDHRLQVHFPTEIYDATTYLDNRFAVDSVSTPYTRSMLPQGAFVTIAGNESGLTLSNRGLPEVSVSQHSEGTDFALTLLRGVGTTGSPEKEWGTPQAAIPSPGGQCLGDYNYQYSLIPHGADLLSAWREAWATQSDLVAIDIVNSSGEMRPVNSFVLCDCDGFLITSIKQAADSSTDLIVRGYNITSARQKVTMRMAAVIREVHCTGLDEHTTIEKKVKVIRKSHVAFEANPFEIVTLRMAL